MPLLDVIPDTINGFGYLFAEQLLGQLLGCIKFKLKQKFKAMIDHTFLSEKHVRGIFLPKSSRWNNLQNYDFVAG
jgi:hypothetical protein